MANIKLTASGKFKKASARLKHLSEKKYLEILDKYGQKGVEALKAATPVDTGKTADSWSYKIVNTPFRSSITWSNSSTTNTGIPIVVLLHYGHGTGFGGYVEGIDFINPAIKPIFKEIAKKVWEEVTDR